MNQSIHAGNKAKKESLNGIVQKWNFSNLVVLLLLTIGTFAHQAWSANADKRHNTDGGLDTTFNSTGIVTTAIGTGGARANAIAVQSDGKIVAAGYSVNGRSFFALVRYNTDGSLDTTFNSTGIVTTAIGTGGARANAVAVQSDGKIAASGYSVSGRSFFSLVR